MVCSTLQSAGITVAKVREPTAVAIVAIMASARGDNAGNNDEHNEKDGHDAVGLVGHLMGAGGVAWGPAVGQEGANEPGDAGEESDAKHPPVQIAATALLAISL